MALTRESAVFSLDALPAATEPMRVRKVPAGIADLDSIVNGGFPSGSTILLLGGIGAGMQEYIYTAASKTALVHERPEARRYYLGDHCDDSELPERVCYVTSPVRRKSSSRSSRLRSTESTIERSATGRCSRISRPPIFDTAPSRPRGRIRRTRSIFHRRTSWKS